MSGITAAEKITEFLDVPIIFLTASTDQASLIQDVGGGTCAFINKPFEEAELTAAIELARSKSHFIDAGILSL